MEPDNQGLSISDISTSPIIADSPPALDNQSKIKLPAPLTPYGSTIGLSPNTTSTSTPLEVFGELLSSLTFELSFTSQNRLSIKIPSAFQTTDHPLFSVRLLPHPEKLQSTALLNNNKLVANHNDKPIPPLQKSGTLNKTFWLSMLTILLIGAMIFFVWQFRKRLILRV